MCAKAVQRRGAVQLSSPKGSADGLHWHAEVKRFCLVPAITVPPRCTDLFVVADVLLDTVRDYLEMILFCEVNNTL